MQPTNKDKPPAWQRAVFGRPLDGPAADLTEVEIVEHSVPIARSKAAGVYFLISEGRIIYVGSSVLMIGRVAFHVRKGFMRFDRVAAILCDHRVLRATEDAYIAKFNPIYNRANKSGVSFPDDIVAGEAIHQREFLTFEESAAYVIRRWFRIGELGLQDTARPIQDVRVFGKHFYSRTQIDAWMDRIATAMGVKPPPKMW